MVFPQNSIKKAVMILYRLGRQTCVFCPERFSVLSEQEKGRAP